MFVAVYRRYSDKVEDGQFIFLGKQAEKRIMLFNCANQIVFENNNNKKSIVIYGPNLKDNTQLCEKNIIVWWFHL